MPFLRTGFFDRRARIRGLLPTSGSAEGMVARLELPQQKSRLLLVGHRYLDVVDRLARGGYCFSVDSISDARLALARNNFDAVLVDGSGNDEAGASAAALLAEYPDLEVILLEADEPARRHAQSAGIEALDPECGELLAERLGAVACGRREAFARSRSAAIELQNREYKQLLESFGAPNTRDEIARVAAAVAQRLLLAQGAAIGNFTGSQLECIGACGQMAQMRGESVPRGGFLDVLGDSRQAMRVQAQGKFGDTLAQLSAEAGIASAAVAPIHAKEQLIGILAVTSSKEGAFTDADLRSMQGLADLIGIGLALKDAEDLRASFLRDLVAGIEDERRRLAREIHDEAGQLLTALVVTLHALEKSHPSGPDPKLVSAQQLASRTVVELQRIARGLRPAAITELSFEQALLRLAEDHRRVYGTRIDVACNGLLTGPDLPTDVQVALYRIVQEALTNIARHAAAKVVGILVRRADGKIRVIIEDDGCGMDPSAGGPGAGLRNMRERTQMLGGTFTLESTLAVGTALYIELPLGGSDAENLGARR